MDSAMDTMNACYTDRKTASLSFDFFSEFNRIQKNCVKLFPKFIKIIKLVY